MEEKLRQSCFPWKCIPSSWVFISKARLNSSYKNYGDWTQLHYFSTIFTKRKFSIFLLASKRRKYLHLQKLKMAAVHRGSLVQRSNLFLYHKVMVSIDTHSKFLPQDLTDSNSWRLDHHVFQKFMITNFKIFHAILLASVDYLQAFLKWDLL